MPGIEQTPNNPDTKLIEDVPGVPPSEYTPPSRDVVRIPAGEFRGDPSRVIGHPANPATHMDLSQIFKSEQTGNREPSVATESPEMSSDLITIPPEVQAHLEKQ